MGMRNALTVSLSTATPNKSQPGLSTAQKGPRLEEQFLFLQSALALSRLGVSPGFAL